MILISNNVRGRIPIPEDAVIRVNMAYYSTKEALLKAVNDITHDVFLDYPQDRIKPPKPVLNIEDALHIMERSNHIKYFAVSNAEDLDFIKKLRISIPQRITLIPKIETLKGVNLVKELTEAAKSNIVMLDKEDLYVNTRSDFVNVLANFITRCRKLEIELLELEGVIFYARTAK